MSLETVSPAARKEESGFDVLDVLLLLARRWRLIALLTVTFAIAGVLLSFGLTKRYSATVTFLVDQETSSAGVFLFRQNDPTISLLQSRAISEFVLTHIGADAFAGDGGRKAINENDRLGLSAKVQSETSTSHSDQGMYTVKVQDRSPQRAVAIANAYLDALQDLSNRMSFEGASRSRAFYQEQVNSERAALEKAEAELKTQQEHTGLLQPTSQTSLGLSQIASLRSQIVGLEVQRANIAQSATMENPEMQRLNAQISELQGRVGALQARVTGSSGQDLPTQNLETERLQRDVAYHENLLTSLAAQFERARLQENFGVPRVHVVDRATMPVPKTFPNRLAIGVALAALGMFLGLLYTIATALLARLHRDPTSSGKLRELRRAFQQRA